MNVETLSRRKANLPSLMASKEKTTVLSRGGNSKGVQFLLAHYVNIYGEDAGYAWSSFGK